MLFSPYLRQLFKHFLLSVVLVFTVSIQCFALEPETLILNLKERDVSVWKWQAEGKKQGIILFSHGAFSAPWKYKLLIQPWVEQGFTVYAPLHIDSTDHPEKDKYTHNMSWQARLEDMQMLADTYGGERYIAAGHSYGALTALVKGGVKATIPDGMNPSQSDPRVALVLAYSPPPAMPGLIDKQGFSGLAVPALIQTGTDDIPMGASSDWSAHLDAYEMAPATHDHYAIVLDDVDHYFGGAICRPELAGPKQLAELNQTSDISALMINGYFLAKDDAIDQLTSLLSPVGPTALSRK
ncbi:alpha/beta hydrolase family protein [Aliiglaciecola sp. SL4]|uniref:alpha/beta hydrolase family protein n=1 Tax=Aliiglaciecola sp. SL4 TaxID=3239806 RepID=UPI00355B2CF1